MHPSHTANDRFKSGFGSAFWLALIAATALHLALFLGSPTFAVAMAGGAGAPPLEVVSAEPPLPHPPEAIPRPAAPVVSDVVPPAATVPPNIPEAGTWRRLEAPRPAAGEEEGRAHVFIPFEVAPVLRNPAEVQRALRRVYPSALRDAGIGGTVRVWFHIDERGRVMETELHGSSGFDAFDRAALEVAEVMTFTPAQNRDRPVPVWVTLEIRFEVQ